jgi:hypothetical protein
MKPVYQRIIDAGKGDCFAACLASILELPLESVPNFRALETPEADMNKLAREWLKENYNLSLVCIYNGKEIISGEDFRVIGGLVGTPCIGTVISPNFENAQHAVVGQIDKHGMNFELLHDPNPNGKEIKTRPLFLQFLVPMNPAQLKISENQ